MSEKYSTDELVTELRDIVNCANRLEGEERFVLANEESFLDIIARLRAADALVNAVREWASLSISVRKAIADYEGKEEA